MEIQDASTGEVTAERTGVEGRNRSRPQYVMLLNSMQVGQRKHLCSRVFRIFHEIVMPSCFEELSTSTGAKPEALMLE